MGHTAKVSHRAFLAGVPQKAAKLFTAARGGFVPKAGAALLTGLSDAQRPFFESVRRNRDSIW
jgi:hypothetical protein